MLAFAHAGIGWKIAKPFAGRDESRGLEMKWVLLGTLLPDLIDKPLYYVLSWATGLRGTELGLICGTRTFGHTALLLFVVLVAGYALRSRVLAAIALGMSTHILLDQLGDSVQAVLMHGGVRFDWASPRLVGLLWPFLGNHFPVYPYTGAADHLGSVFVRPYIVLGELAGIFLLWTEWKRRPRR